MPDEFNPFQILTFIVAPAILTNASTVMTLGTSNRLARAIDRVRALAAQLEARAPEVEQARELRLRQLASAERRVLIIVRALTAFYLSVGSFAAASLVSLFGAVFFVGHQDELRHVMLAMAVGAGIVGVGALVVGSTLLVWESRLSWQILRDEIDFRTHAALHAELLTDRGADSA